MQSQNKYFTSEQMKSRLYADVSYLTSVKPARSYENLKILNQVSEKIFRDFTQSGLKVEYQNFRVDGKDYRNVIGYAGPDTKERIVVGAHYDVCGDQPGADDNASAVAGLLELARLAGHDQQKLKTRIEFVAYCLEEPPYFATENMGSARHAKLLHDEKVNVKLMVCLEMIGYFSDKPGSQGFPDENLKKLYPDKGNFIIVVGKTGQEAITARVKNLMKESSAIGVKSINLPGTETLAGLSDHRNYWKYNYPAIMLNDTSFLRNPNYHKKSDTIETLNFDKMTEVVKGAWGVLTKF